MLILGSFQFSMGFSWRSVGERNSNDDGVMAMTTDVVIFMR